MRRRRARNLAPQTPMEQIRAARLWHTKSSSPVRMPNTHDKRACPSPLFALYLAFGIIHRGQASCLPEVRTTCLTSKCTPSSPLRLHSGERVATGKKDSLSLLLFLPPPPTQCHENVPVTCVLAGRSKRGLFHYHPSCSSLACGAARPVCLSEYGTHSMTHGL